MGSEQSRESNNVQKTRPRKFTEAEVREALDFQKSQMEKEMNDLIRRQMASAMKQPATSTPASTSSSTNSQRTTSSVAQGVNERDRAPYNLTPKFAQRPVTSSQGVTERERTPYNLTPNLAQRPVTSSQGVTERERTPYNLTPNLAQRPVTSSQGVNERERTPYSNEQNANQTRSPLYPTLPTNGNQGPGTNYNHLSPVNSNVYDSRQYGPTSPSAPPMPAPARQGRPISRSPGPRVKAESDDVACPSCKYRYTEKIFNCATGHASCSECMSTQQPCGKCGQRITDMRNITMEEYVTQKRGISCPNADEGCCYTMAPGNLERHLQDCPFKEVQCMLPGNMCVWRGKLSKLADHFEQYHPTSRGEIDTETSLQLNNTNKTIQLIKLGNYNFIIHQYTANDKVYVAGQLIGTKSCALKWCYELHIFKKAEPRRKYVYVDKCFSLRESFADIIKDSKCAVLPMAYAKTFDNGSGSVVYKYYIKKENGGIIDKVEGKRDVSCTRRGRGHGRGRGRGRGGYAN